MPVVDPSSVPPLAVAPERPRRIVYLGTPAMAVPPLRALHDAGFEIPLVVSRPDKRRGRGGQLEPSPVKATAAELDLPVSDRVEDALDAGADLGVVVAFGRIIKRPVLERLPMINLHFSLLPRWRGAAPVERAILAGDTRTGVDVMVVEEGLDTGAVYAEGVVDIGPEETAAELRNQLVVAGTSLLIATLDAGLRDPRPQAGEPTYAEKLGPADLEIDWTAPAEDIHRRVRVGGAWTMLRGKRLKIWSCRIEPGDGTSPAPGALDGERVGTGTHPVRLVEVQPEGKARQSAQAWSNGARLAAGERLGAAPQHEDAP